MKKLVAVLCILFTMTGIAMGVGSKRNTGCYSIKCYKCYEKAVANKYVGCCPGCVAWRMFEKEKGDGWMVYHCEHGHKLYLSTKTEERK